jgi:hypothetical protein
LVGAAGATGALIAAPGLYGRLREAVGAGDVWTDFEPEPDNGGYAAPPPDDTEASDLRSRIEASRQRLRHKAQGGEAEGEDEPDADEPDPVA